MRPGSGGRIVVPLAVVTVLAGLALVPAAALGGHSSRSVPLAGTVDRSFGRGGVVTRRFGNSDSYPGIRGIAVQSDEKIVVAGGNSLPQVGGGHGWVLARYLPNGSLDASFGHGGSVETNGDTSLATSIALQPHGKIVVAGGSSVDDGHISSEFTLARYNPNGSLDTSFGTNGITHTAFPESSPLWDAGASALVVLPSGEILAAGTALAASNAPGQEPSFFALAKYKPDGSLDPTFGDGGIRQTRFDGYLMLSGVAVWPNGKIVATGFALPPPFDGSTSRMALVQYTPDGSLDPTFGNGGEVAGPAVPSSKVGGYAGAPVLQAGKIVVPGGPGLARYLASGRLDTTFGKRGYAAIPGGVPLDVFAQKDGKLLLAQDRDVARLLPNGRVDPTFGVQGIWGEYPAAYPASLGALALQRDGKVLAGGGNSDPDIGTLGWTLVRVNGGNNCVVPELRGETASQATVTLKKSFCRRGRIANRYSSTIARGGVIATAPRHGTRLPGGAKVALVVSRGKSGH